MQYETIIAMQSSAEMPIIGSLQREGYFPLQSMDAYFSHERESVSIVDGLEDEVLLVFADTTLESRGVSFCGAG